MESRAFLCLSGMLFISSITGKQIELGIGLCAWGRCGYIAVKNFTCYMYSYSVADFPFSYKCTGKDGQLRAGESEQVHPYTPR